MNYRRLGKTGLMVSEIGFGAEWMERHTAGECKAVLARAEELGINILDCWMSNPEVRTSFRNRTIAFCKSIQNLMEVFRIDPV